MKRLILLTAVLLLSLYSCRSEQDDDLDNSAYVGTWQWVSTNPGNGGPLETPETTETQATLNFTSDGSYQFTEDGQIVNQGTYKLYIDVTDTDHSEKVFIDFSGREDLMVFSITESQLILVEDKSAGKTFAYSKQ